MITWIPLSGLADALGLEHAEALDVRLQELFGSLDYRYLIVDSNGDAVLLGDLTLESLFFSGEVTGLNAAGPTLLNEAATGTNPTVIPNKADPTAGLGYVGDDLVLIVSSSQVLTIDPNISVLRSNFNIGTNTSGRLLTFNGAATNRRGFNIYTAGLSRWAFRSDQLAEAGSNAGCNLELFASDDAGSDIGQAIFIERKTMDVTLGRNLTITGITTRANSGGYFWSAQGTAAVAVAMTYVKVSTAASTTSIRAENFTIDANNRATYTGASTQTFRVSYSVSMTSESPNETVHFRIAKNGTPIAGSEQHRKVAAAADSGALSCEYFVELVTNDYVELWATNEDSTDDVYVDHGTCIITEA